MHYKLLFLLFFTGGIIYNASFDEIMRDMLSRRPGEAVLLYLEKNPWHKDLGISAAEYRYYRGVANIITARQIYYKKADCTVNALADLEYVLKNSFSVAHKINSCIYLASLSRHEIKNNKAAVRYLQQAWSLAGKNHLFYYSIIYWRLVWESISEPEYSRLFDQLKTAKNARIFDLKTLKFFSLSSGMKNIKSAAPSPIPAVVIKKPALQKILSPAAPVKPPPPEPKKNPEPATELKTEPAPTPPPVPVPPKETAAILLVKAQKALDNEDYDLALEDAGRALTLESSAQAYLLTGQAYYYLENHNKSSAVFKKACSLYPEHAALNYWYGVLLAKNKQYDEAHNYYKKSLSVDPGNPVVLMNLGSLCLLMESFSEAEDAWLQALTLDPENPYIIRNLVIFYAKYKDDQPKAAEYFSRYEKIETNRDSITYIKTFLK
ncbi:MAG TPA: hypothetical protein DC049_13045 [Spirochaetia bacterium]|nr:hypothetical protein [Spirochaetia bacterium]